MRFRAILFAPHVLQAFAQAMGKVGKELVMVLDAKEMRFMTRSSTFASRDADNLSDAFAVDARDFEVLVAYGGTDIGNMCDDVVCQSVSSNQIAISLRADALERALKPRVAARERCLIKLTKHRATHMPMLEISSIAGERAHAHMTQQINIKLIAADEWKKALIEPALGAPDVYIAAPTPLADVKHVLHKLAPHGDHIELAINMSHTLQMAVEDDVTGTITAVWRGMEHPSYIGDKLQKQQPPPPSSDEDEADENDGGNRGGAAPSKAMAVFDLEDADATENATFTRVYVNKSVLNKLLGSTEMFSEGGKARVILCATEHVAFIAHVVKPNNTYMSIYAPVSLR